MILKKTDYKKIAICLLLNIALIVILNLLFVPTEKTDDFIMKCILEGAFSGQSDGHLLYYNYLFGLFLSFLQTNISGIAWITMSQYIVVFVSLCVVSYYVIFRNDYKTGFLLILPVLLFFGFEAYIKITFSKTAAIGMSAGFFWMYKALNKDIKNIAKIIPGLILAFASAMFRNKSLYMIIAVFAGIILIDLITDWNKGLKTVIKQAIVSAIPIICVFVLVFAAKSVGSRMFVEDKGWSQYKTYNNYKVSLQDYGWPSYKEYQAEYEALGISYNDYQMWNNRDYADKDILTNDLLGEIVSIKDVEDENVGLGTLRDYLKRYPRKFFEQNIFWALLLVWAIMIISGNKKMAWIFGYSAFICMLLEFYLYMGGRYAKQHVDVGIFFGAALLCLFYAEANKIRYKETAIAAGLTAIVLSKTIKADYEYMVTPSYTGSPYNISAESAHAAIDQISSDKAHLYVISNDEYYGLLRGYGAFETIKKGSLDNVFIMSSYMYPSHNVVIDNYGKDNIVEALLDDNVYYATTSGEGNAETILLFIQEHYCESADYKYIDSINGLNIYKFER